MIRNNDLKTVLITIFFILIVQMNLFAYPTITVNRATYSPGENIVITFSGIYPASATDWISLYEVGAPNEKYGEWQYLKGQSSGTLTFKAPNKPGNYELRLFLNWPSGGFNVVARSQVITVGDKQSVQPPTQQNIDWLSHIKSGKPFNVVFDEASKKFNDEGWLFDRDPMGTIKAGETYTVTYNPNLGWTAKGLNENSGMVIQSISQGLLPDNGHINIWGRGFVFNRLGELFDYDFGLVGHIYLVDSGILTQDLPNKQSTHLGNITTLELNKSYNISTIKSQPIPASFGNKNSYFQVFKVNNLTPGIKYMLTLTYPLGTNVSYTIQWFDGNPFGNNSQSLGWESTQTNGPTHITDYKTWHLFMNSYKSKSDTLYFIVYSDKPWQFNISFTLADPNLNENSKNSYGYFSVTNWAKEPFVLTNY